MQKFIMPLLMIMIVVVAASAQTWSPEQKEIWQFEQKQWAMEAAKDSSWINTMVHDNISYWSSNRPAPQNKASLLRWNRYNSNNRTVLAWELFPSAITITGNIAVVQYRYSSGEENYKGEREVVTGHYTDILIKEGGRWLFIAWDGGEDPKKD